MFSTPAAFSILSVLIVSAVSASGIIFLMLATSSLQRIIFLFVSFATGAILGNVFFHLFPEMIEHADEVNVSLLVFLGILGSFIVEKFIHWHHCHDVHCKERSNAVGSMVLIGDAVHNIMDGILIATAYLVDVQLGIATTIAVVLHEIPQEIGDYAILLHSGYSKMKALLWNFFSALTAILGALFVLIAGQWVHDIEIVLLPIVVGNFLYIALADLIPELHREVRPSRALLQFVCVVLGGMLLYVISTNTTHPHVDEPRDEHVEEGVDEHATRSMPFSGDGLPLS
ncbi:MAG: ZIP family metal transporter [Candidatus Peribacteraceae bacterium]